jgi:hypothetical protein
MYTGREAKEGHFSETYVSLSDMLEVEDDMIRKWIFKVLRMGGCRVSRCMAIRLSVQ